MSWLVKTCVRSAQGAPTSLLDASWNPINGLLEDKISFSSSSISFAKMVTLDAIFKKKIQLHVQTKPTKKLIKGF